MLSANVEGTPQDDEDDTDTPLDEGPEPLEWWERDEAAHELDQEMRGDLERDRT